MFDVAQNLSLTVFLICHWDGFPQLKLVREIVTGTPVSGCSCGIHAALVPLGVNSPGSKVLGLAVATGE